MPMLDMWIASYLVTIPPVKNLLILLGIGDGPRVCRTVSKNRRAEQGAVRTAQTATFLAWISLALWFFAIMLITGISAKLAAGHHPVGRPVNVVVGILVGAITGSMAIAGVGMARMTNGVIPPWLAWLYRPSHLTFWVGLAVSVSVAALMTVH